MTDRLRETKYKKLIKAQMEIVSVNFRRCPIREIHKVKDISLKKTEYGYCIFIIGKPLGTKERRM